MPRREPEEEGTEEFAIDMSQAKIFEPLPERKPLLAAVSKWKYGKTPNGRKLDYAFTVVEPSELANRQVPESLSLENEYTLGRYQTMLLALGFPEDEVKSKTHKPPKEEDVLGLQATIFCRTRHSDTYGDRSQISRVRPASAYKEAAAY
jgi:hypothetical protein